MLRKGSVVIFITVLAGIFLMKYLQRNETSMGYGLLEIVLYGCFILTLLHCIYKAFTSKVNNTVFQKFKTFVFGLILVPLFYLASWLSDTDGGKRKLITGGLFRDLYFIHFDLFSDSTFKILNSGAFGGTFYRGKYYLQNDTLRIENESLRYLFPTLAFAIKAGKDDKKYLEPCDTNKSEMQLEITNDFRR